MTFGLDLPPWALHAIWTAITLAAAWATGHVINAVVIARLGRIARLTQAHWDEILVAELRRRVPLSTVTTLMWSAAMCASSAR